MKRLSIVPSWARQAKRDKPQRFKQLPTSWWSVLHAYLKKLRQAARKSSASCQTTVNHSPHPSAPIKTLHQKVYPKQQLWQRLKGPSTDSHSTLGSNITSSCSQPSVNFSLRLSPAIPAGSHSLAHRGLSALLINHPSLKVSGISQLTDMNSLLKYASLKPLPLIIHTSTPTLSILPLPESQHNQKKAALVYLPKQINHLPPLPPIMVVNKPPQPLDADWQWLANKPRVIDPTVKITNPAPEGSTVKETEPEKSTQKKSQNKSFEKDLSFHILEKKSQELSTFQKSKKRCNSYSVSELEQPPRKRAKLAPNSDLDKTRTSLIESENKGIYPFIEITHPFLEKSTVTETKSEKASQKKSQNTTCKRRLFFYTLKNKFQELPTSQKSKKCCHPDSGSELAETPKKRAKLEYNPYLDEAETPLNEPENDIDYPSLEKFSVTEKEPEKGTLKKTPKTVIKEAKYPRLWNISYRSKRKHHNPYSLLTLEEPPKKHTRLESNSTLGEAGTSLIEPGNKGVYPFVEITNPSPEGSTVKETEPEKPTQKESKFKLLKSEKMPHILWSQQQSRKRYHPDFGPELTEPPKKRAKLASNLDSNKIKDRLIESKDEAIYPLVEMINPSPEGSAVKETEPKKSTQKKLQDNRFEKAVFFKSSKASSPDPDEISTPLIEPENKDKQSIECNDYRVETITEKTDSSTEKWSGSELLNSEPSETETAIESDWCYTLAAYGYDPQHYPLLTQLPDDCHWGKRILRDFEPEDIFWLDSEEKSMLWGVRHFPVLAEFFQIDPLTYQHPYLEQAINAYTAAPTESLPCSANPVAVAPPPPALATPKHINLTHSLFTS